VRVTTRRPYVVIAPDGAELEVAASNPHLALVMSITPGAGLVVAPRQRDHAAPRWQVRPAGLAMPCWLFVVRAAA
jgi:hypothetical protein